ncbi:MAG: GH25 family lysozyme [Candidatus Velamenicoccus archaeovorus]
MEVVRAKRRAIRIAISLLAVAGVTASMAAVPAGAAPAGHSFRPAAGAIPSAIAAPPPGAVPGIDVSHHQGEIDWAQVAASGVRFAIAKATEGLGYDDPMYATNRAGATAAGITFGAYHFARPDLHPNNPIGEADHFVDTAQLGPGNIVPVLDLERSGTLTQAQLTAWILDWLDEVTVRTGVRPMVYTSPNGWANRTGDTTAVADAGYTLLWVAHWGVSSPTVPADDWQGNGWTFWQYSNQGSVPGIGGRVDLDWYETSDFTPVTIPSPDTVAPVATLGTPTGVLGPVTVSFSEIVHGVTPQNVLITAQGSPVASSVTCWSKRGVQVDCTSGKVITAIVTPAEPLLSGQTYEAAVNPTGVTPPVVDRAGNPASPVVQPFAPPTELEQGSPAITYAWRRLSAPRAFGRSFVVERTAGATASFSFTGNAVSWYTVTGPAQGRAAVSIDGRPRGTFDQFARAARVRVARTFSRLGPGDHRITIRVLGTTTSPGGGDTQVVVDAFGVGSTVVRTPELDLAWGKGRVRGASGGTVGVTDLGRAEATLPFWGTGVRWRTLRAPDQGRAAIYLDGALLKTVDDYAPSPTFVDREIGGLPVGRHELRIVVLGSSRPKATGTAVTIDTLTVLP